MVSNFMCIESYINLAVNLGAFYVLLTVCQCYILNNIVHTKTNFILLDLLAPLVKFVQASTIGE
jgi:hypothetical protein